MVLVFGAFVLGGQRVIELFGVGLASAVLLDALIVRSVLVPSLMLMFGAANWRLPAFLDRVLPHFGSRGRRRAGHAAAAGQDRPRRRRRSPSPQPSDTAGSPSPSRATSAA